MNIAVKERFISLYQKAFTPLRIILISSLLLYFGNILWSSQFDDSTIYNRFGFWEYFMPVLFTSIFVLVIQFTFFYNFIKRLKRASPEPKALNRGLLIFDSLLFIPGIIVTGIFWFLVIVTIGIILFLIVNSVTTDVLPKIVTRGC